MMSEIKNAWWPYARNCLYWYKRRPDDLTETQRQAVQRALEDIDTLPDAKQRRIIIDQVMLRNWMTLEGAAEKASISYSTARRYHQHAIKRVAYYLGLIN